MEKALEILKTFSRYYTGSFAIKIKEAIKELEELENRSCNTCKSNFCSIKRILTREDEIDSNYFYCNDWENKA